MHIIDHNCVYIYIHIYKYIYTHTNYIHIQISDCEVYTGQASVGMQAQIEVGWQAEMLTACIL